MNYKQHKTIKTLLYLGLIFLFFALTIKIGIHIYFLNSLYYWSSGYYGYLAYLPYHISRCVGWAFIDIFTILLIIYWILKIIIPFLTIDDEIKKGKILNYIKSILYFGLFFLFLGLTILVGVFADFLNSLNNSYLRYKIRYAAVVFIDIFAILLVIFWVLKIITLFLNDINNDIKIEIKKYTNLFLYFGLFFLFLSLTFHFEIHIVICVGDSWIKFVSWLFFDFFAISLMIYWMLKIIFFILNNIILIKKSDDKITKEKIKKNKIILPWS